MVGKQKHKRDDKAKRQNNQHIKSWMIVLVVWIILSGFWCFYVVAIHQDTSTSIWLELETITSYSTLLEKYSRSQITSLFPLVVPIVTVGICVRISWLYRRGWLILITILLVIPMGFSFWLIATLTLFHGNTLYHLDTINKDGNVYHLAYGEYGKGDLIADKYLLLFTCDDSDDVCTASGHVSFPYGTFENRFSINENNQLQVVSDNRIVFTLEDS